MKITIYSTYLATCRQLDVPRCLMLYLQYVSATLSVISVRNHSQTSPRLSRFQLSEARFITSINIICLSSHSAVATILLLNTYQKGFLCYHLPRSLKMFFNMFSFLHVKANLRRIREEISLPFFSEKCCRQQ